MPIIVDLRVHFAGLHAAARYLVAAIAVVARTNDLDWAMRGAHHFQATAHPTTRPS
jgi:hypothetical protein